MFPAFLREIRTGKIIHFWLSDESYSNFFQNAKQREKSYLTLLSFSLFPTAQDAV